MPKASRILTPACFHRKDAAGDHFAFVLDLQEDPIRRPSGGCVIGRHPHSDSDHPGVWLRGWGLKPRNLFPTGTKRLDALSNPDSGWAACAPSRLPPGSMNEIAAFASEWIKDKNHQYTGEEGLFHTHDGRILVFESGTDTSEFSSHEKLEVLVDIDTEDQCLSVERNG